MSYLRKTINLIPPDYRDRRAPSAVPSLLVTAGLLALVTGLCLGLTDPPPPAHSAPPPLPALDPASRRFRVVENDPAALSLERARLWFPWHQLCATLTRLPSDKTRLDSVRFRADSGEIVISGELQELSEVAALMIELDRFEWLANLDPRQVEKDLRTGAMRFKIHASVAPYVVLEKKQ